MPLPFLRKLTLENTWSLVMILLAYNMTYMIKVASAASGQSIEKAYSGGEVPYHFADTSSELQAAAKDTNKQSHTPSLASIDDESVFDPMTDLAVPDAAKTPQQAAGADQEDDQEDEPKDDLPADEDLQNEGDQADAPQAEEDEQALRSYAGDDSNLSVPESPADSWIPDSSVTDALPSSSIPSQAGDYSWSADLMGRLNLGDASAGGASPSDRQSDRQPTTPNTAAAVGSAPTSTLSEFSAVGREGTGNGMSNRDSANRGSANNRQRTQNRPRRDSYGNNR